jgi:hypothetical protein
LIFPGEIEEGKRGREKGSNAKSKDLSFEEGKREGKRGQTQNLKI